MGFSSEWEQVYRQGAQHSIWPWSDLVSYVMRYAAPERRPFRVLELGFGAGANIAFFLELGSEYFGTEGSETAVRNVRARFGSQQCHVACCDFTESIPFDGPFDLIADRSSLTHNGTAAIRSCLNRLHGLLGPQGKLIGIDWFSTVNRDFHAGSALEDRYTRTGYPSGQFSTIGTVHFFDETHLRGLLVGAGFQIARLEHKRVDTLLPADTGPMAWWNFVASRQ